MIKIGDFSKLSFTTVKTLRYYDDIGLLPSSFVDPETNYRYYQISDLLKLQKIMHLKQAGLKIEEIKQVISGNNFDDILNDRKTMLLKEKDDLENKLLKIEYIIKMEEKMNYTISFKRIPSYIVFYRQGIIKDFSEIGKFVVDAGTECREHNKALKCIEPDYCYVSYLDKNFKKTNLRIEYAQAVEKAGAESENIKFKRINEVDAICTYHEGAYANLPNAYAAILKFIKENGYQITDAPRENYIEGVWSQTDESKYLTEVQFPVKKI